MQKDIDRKFVENFQKNKALIFPKKDQISPMDEINIITEFQIFDEDCKTPKNPIIKKKKKDEAEKMR